MTRERDLEEVRSERFRAAFGELEVTRLPTRKAERLLNLLAVEPGVPLPRSELARTLWPTKGLEEARLSLRQTIFLIRKEFGRHEVIQGDGDAIWVHPELQRVGSGWEAQRERRAAQNAGGALLDAAETVQEQNPSLALDILASAPDAALIAGRERFRILCLNLLKVCQPSASYARVLFAIASTSHGDDYLKSIELYNRCREMADDFGERQLCFRATSRLIFANFEVGRLTAAFRLFEIEETPGEPNPEAGRSLMVHALGMALAHEGELSRGSELLARASADLLRGGATQDFVHCAINQGWIASQQEDRQTLEDTVRTALPMAQEGEHVREIGILDYIRAQAHILDENWGAALQALRLNWATGMALHEKATMAQCLESVGEVKVKQGEFDQGAEFLVRAHFHRSSRRRRYSTTETRRICKSASKVKHLLTSDNVSRWTQEQARLEKLDFRDVVCPF